MEVALVLVLGIETGVGVGPDEVASGDRRLEQRDVVDVGPCRLRCVKDVRHVYEDGDVFAHERLLDRMASDSSRRPWYPLRRRSLGCSATTGLFSGQPDPYP